ncbi:MAG: hybrid sensor histidine kinase/response regulator, partial [Pseudomonadota bacterium]
VFDAAGPDDAAALQEFGDVRPSAMLIDYQLDDGENGVDLALDLRRRLGDVPTRIISADRSQTLRRRCAGAGLSFLNKPLSTAALQSFLTAAQTDSRTLKL